MRRQGGAELSLMKRQQGEGVGSDGDKHACSIFQIKPILLSYLSFTAVDCWCFILIDFVQFLFAFCPINFGMSWTFSCKDTHLSLLLWTALLYLAHMLLIRPAARVRGGLVLLNGLRVRRVI
jgi:hypothetical protein